MSWLQEIMNSGPIEFQIRVQKIPKFNFSQFFLEIFGTQLASLCHRNHYFQKVPNEQEKLAATSMSDVPDGILFFFQRMSVIN